MQSARDHATHMRNKGLTPKDWLSILSAVFVAAGLVAALASAYFQTKADAEQDKSIAILERAKVIEAHNRDVRLIIDKIHEVDQQRKARR